MLYTLENSYLLLECSKEGAEIKSLVFKPSGREAIWQADPEYWARHAPVLFPIVGKALDNSILCHEKLYPISQHGFARDRVFDLKKISADNIAFELKSDEETFKFYPYSFNLSIEYTLEGRSVVIDYIVHNPGDDILPFSIGAHPAFNLDIPPDRFEDYKIVFEHTENARQLELRNGLIAGYLPKSLLDNSKAISLTAHIFDNDALIFENIQSSYISIEHNTLGEVIKLHAQGYPYFGIWSKPNAPFVCLEPWFGLADSANQRIRIEEKTGIQLLNKGETFHFQYKIEVLQ